MTTTPQPASGFAAALGTAWGKALAVLAALTMLIGIAVEGVTLYTNILEGRIKLEAATQAAKLKAAEAAKMEAEAQTAKAEADAAKLRKDSDAKLAEQKAAIELETARNAAKLKAAEAAKMEADARAAKSAADNADTFRKAEADKQKADATSADSTAAILKKREEATKAWLQRGHADYNNGLRGNK